MATESRARVFADRGSDARFAIAVGTKKGDSLLLLDGAAAAMLCHGNAYRSGTGVIAP